VNRKLALVIAIVASLASMAVINEWLGSSWHGSENDLSFLAYVIGSAIAGGLQAFNESKRDKPNFEHIFLAAFFSYFGIGMAVYEWLTKGTKSEEDEFYGS
jgi:peptidoglycan/LPS O-acetylase OafA/YrhL